MADPLIIKICGIKTYDLLDTVIEAGADMVGFMHFQRSPRHVSVEDLAGLISAARGQVQSCVVLVNPDNSCVAEIAALGHEQGDVKQGRAGASEIGRQCQQAIIAMIGRTQPQPGIEQGYALRKMVHGQLERLGPVWWVQRHQQKQIARYCLASTFIRFDSHQCKTALGPIAFACKARQSLIRVNQRPPPRRP